MKRILGLLLITATLLAGCANSDGSTPDEATPVEATPDFSATRDFKLPEPTEPPSLEELVQARYDEIVVGDYSGRAVLDDIDEIIQYPELPTGCESVALTIGINHFGYGLDKTDVVDKYLIYGDSYVTSFYGNPYGNGAGIFPPGLVDTVWNFIDDTDAELYPIDTTGLTMKELYRFLDNDCPVMVWTTMYMNWPYPEAGEEYNDRYYPWYENEHCVCMYGYDKDENDIYIADPQRGKITVSASEFTDIYDEIGRFSMILIDTSELR